MDAVRGGELFVWFCIVVLGVLVGFVIIAFLADAVVDSRDEED